MSAADLSADDGGSGGTSALALPSRDGGSSGATGDGGGKLRGRGAGKGGGAQLELHHAVDDEARRGRDRIEPP